MASTINENHVKGMVIQSICSTLKESLTRSNQLDHLDHYYREVCQMVTVNMIELSTDPSNVIIDDWHQDYLEKQLHRIERYHLIRGQYMKKKRRFIKEFDYYRRSVAILVNDVDIRDELVHYIRTAEIPQISLSDPIRENIIAKILTTKNEPISFDQGQIGKEKNDSTRVAFWVTRFRDCYCNEAMKLRPKTPMLFRPGKPYKSLLQRNPVARIAEGIHQDSRLKMVLIQIILPGNLSISLPSCEGEEGNEASGPDKKEEKLNFHPTFSYLDKMGQFRSPTRILNENGPSCV